MNFYTYVHVRADDGKVFYVGKGTIRHGRAYCAKGRSVFWKRVAEKHGYTVAVCMHFVVEAEAFAHERFLIQCFRDIKAPLVNLTDGGEGLSGMNFSAEHRARLAEASRVRPFTAEMREKVRVASTGRVPSAEARAKMSAAGKGRPKSAAHRAKIAAANAGKNGRKPLGPGEHGPNWGVKFSAESRARMAAAHLGKKRNAAAH